MPPAETKLTFKASIPPALQDLLAREAAFGMSRSKIGDAVEVAKQTREAIAMAKPAFSFVRQEAKRQHLEKLQEAEESLAILEAGARELDASIPALRACVDRSLENYLREYDPEYISGLSASRFYTDWQRVLARFDQAVEQYLGALARLGPTLEALGSNETCGTHSDGRDLIEKAAGHARTLLDEIAFLNKIADAQRQRAGGASNALMRQPERKWRGLLLSFLLMLPLRAAKLVKGLQNDSMEVIEQVRSGIMEQCRLAKYAGGYGVASYHEHTRTTWLEDARQKIPADELERIVAETADRIQAGKLEEWIPVRAEPLPDTAAATDPGAVPSGRPNAIPLPAKAPAPKPAVPVPVAPPPPPPEPPVVIPVRSLSLRRSGSPAPAASPVPAQAAASVVAPQPAVAPTAQDAATLAELKAERERLEGLLNETKASLVEREQFLSESEARLMQTSQAQLEREVELEQREEQLRELEKRLRELQPGALPAEKAPEKKFDEFNE